MILKKSLRRGQATLEYFLIFAAILTFSLLSISAFFSKVRNTAEGTGVGTSGYSYKAIDAITKADLRY